MLNKEQKEAAELTANALELSVKVFRSAIELMEKGNSLGMMKKDVIIATRLSEEDFSVGINVLVRLGIFQEGHPLGKAVNLQKRMNLN